VIPPVFVTRGRACDILRGLLEKRVILLRQRHSVVGALKVGEQDLSRSGVEHNVMHDHAQNPAVATYLQQVGLEG
jgi:hypothetical protein